MKVFLAGNTMPELYIYPTIYKEKNPDYKPFILESFYYTNKDTEKLLHMHGDYLLDSGAFTFMQSSHKEKVDWEDYIRKYAEYINKHDIDKFFELDIDSVVGYEKVLEYRKLLEKLTGKKCIPVWHSWRGLKEFEKSCKEYPYVAIGGLVGIDKQSEYKKSAQKYFDWFIQTAHKNGAKIHALGYTSLEGMKKYHFDSVDSTAWTGGNRFGFVYYFNGETMKKVDKPKGKAFKDVRQLALHNYLEWCKFQRYALTHY